MLSTILWSKCWTDSLVILNLKLTLCLNVFNTTHECKKTTISYLVYTVWQSCKFGLLKDELIRDRIVVGIVDKAVSETLQLTSDFTLNDAKMIVKQAETQFEQSQLMKELKMSKLSQFVCRKDHSMMLEEILLLHKKWCGPARIQSVLWQKGTFIESFRR